MNDKFGLAKIQVGVLQTNCYIVYDPETFEALVIDPGGEAGRLIKLIKDKKLKPVAIVNTHGHADHIGANEAVKKVFGTKIYIHREEEAFLADPMLNGSSMLPESMASASKADGLLDEGSELKAGKLVFRVIHTPGHTPGGICLALKGALFTGDTLFRGDIGRSDLAGGDEEALMNSLKIFRKFPAETAVYPGHGPASTIERELSDNPYLT